MCGLTGFLYNPARTSADRALTVVRQMSNAILHRGPDSDGYWTDPEAGIAFGHRRLAIVDLTEAGHQPMVSRSERYILAFNGEIYNHLRLRSELERSSGHTLWIGHSDTETLLAAVDAWGLVETIRRCTGMFAIALWDRQERQLFLVRDRFGEKPLYYGWQGESFLFGSELKALRAHPEFSASLQRDALPLFLRHNYIPAPYSIYEGIYKLPPASILSISYDNHTPKISSYWSAVDVALTAAAKSTERSDDEAINALEALLRDAVRDQMVSDVPLGAFLSGGIDSSTVVALMQAESDRRVRTFTIGFSESGYNEAAHAGAVAKHLGTEHTEFYVTPEQALDVIPLLPSMYDEPFADSSQIPTYLVSKMARQHVTVALSGDAGDESFAGYNRYLLTAKLWKFLGKIPVGLRALTASAIHAIPPDFLNQIGERLPFGPHISCLGDKLHKGADVMAASSIEALYTGLVSHWQFPERVALSGNVETSPFARAPDLSSLGPIEKMMALDAITYLPDDILVKTDRAAMAISLETRVPFLDHRIFEFAWSLPMHQKIRDGRGKWALRQVLYRHVPQELIDRPKMGFGIPLNTWLRGPLRNWAEDLLSEDRLKGEGYFDPHPIRQRWKEHLSGQRNWGQHLWGVLSFEAWLQNNKTSL